MPARATSSSRAGADSSNAATDVIAAAGRPLDASTRASMEPRFKHDFSSVRIHDDHGAATAARHLGADAFTVDRHIVFGRGRHAPSTPSGRELLAHELAHVVQQDRAGSRGLIQRKPSAIRFQDEPTLEEVSEGHEVLKAGDKGEAVVRVNIALSELGHFRIKNRYVPPEFYWRTTKAVKDFQAAKSLGSAVQEGAVDQPTFQALDAEFSADHTAERGVLAGQKAPNLLKGTQFVDATERTAAKRAVSTEVRPDPVTGALPAFEPDVVGLGNYESRLKSTVESVILDEYDAMGKDKAAAHADPTKLFDWTEIEAVAAVAKDAVDVIFGEYTKSKSPPALIQGTNIFDAWEHKEALLADPAKQDDAVEWRVQKILDGDPAVDAIDREHKAIQERPAEKAIVDRVRGELVVKYRTELLETHKGWPGFADDKKIYIQRFRMATDAENRNSMWEFFRTFIHEYIHTLEHPKFGEYRDSLDEQKGGFVLREGTADYFTAIVWEGIVVDDALRKKVEGPFHDPLVATARPNFGGYDEAVNAERLAGIVGLRNLAGAFFLGKLQLIGK